MKYLFAALFVLYSITFWGLAQGKNLFQVEDKSIGVIVVLTDEPCAIDKVKHALKDRATWTEKGKVYQGCWGEEQGVVVAYWLEDNSVSYIPKSAFKAFVNAEVPLIYCHAQGMEWKEGKCVRRSA